MSNFIAETLTAGLARIRAVVIRHCRPRGA
jgi:hypothetical protein